MGCPEPPAGDTQVHVRGVGHAPAPPALRAPPLRTLCCEGSRRAPPPWEHRPAPRCHPGRKGRTVLRGSACLWPKCGCGPGSAILRLSASPSPAGGLALSAGRCPSPAFWGFGRPVSLEVELRFFIFYPFCCVKKHGSRPALESLCRALVTKPRPDLTVAWAPPDRESPGPAGTPSAPASRPPREGPYRTSPLPAQDDVPIPSLCL